MLSASSRKLFLPIAVLSTLALAAPAFAATVSGTTSVSVTGTGAAEDIDVTCEGGVVTVTGPDTGGTCAQVESLSIHPDDGADEIDLRGVTAAEFAAVQTVNIYTDDDESTTFVGDHTEGSDLAEIYFNDTRDTTSANGGDDYIFEGGGDATDGGDGDDTIELVGSTNILGGAGDDVFLQSIGDVNDGGPGHDLWSANLAQYTTAQNLEVEYSVTFDDTRLYIDAVTPDTVIDESVLMLDFEELELKGFLYVGESYDLREFPGSATIWSRSGDDTIVGSRASDRFNTGSGNDTLDVRDGVVDVVDCGPGADTVRADVNDILTGCEDVDVPAPKTSKIKGPGKVKRGTSASFTFSASPSAGVVYQCKLDNTGWKKCKSPYKLGKGKTKKLKVGKHKLSVRAGYPGGPYDSSPAKKKFKVKK